MKPSEMKAGLIFGRLTTIKYSKTDAKSRQYWLCKCSCGIEKIVSTSHLISGHTKSCGCLSDSLFSALIYKHGGYGTPEYLSYRSMIQRCTNPNNPDYKRYGGRGISICKRWLGEHGFENFLADTGPRPVGKTLDRFPNPDGNYTPKNIRWANRKEQRQNQSGRTCAV
jgi:hypothetical protein